MLKAGSRDQTLNTLNPKSPSRFELNVFDNDETSKVKSNARKTQGFAKRKIRRKARDESREKGAIFATYLREYASVHETAW